MKRLISYFSFFLICCTSGAQNPVNAFAAVTAITGNSVLTVSNVLETYHTFEDGERVIVMQMQDSVIGTNTTNVSTFGDLGSIRSAGLFEVATILSHTESSGLPTGITLAGPLANTYNIGAKASVQIITFRNFGNNYSTTANIGTAAWNGTLGTGGVTAISVNSVLTLGHNISANFAGFRGGVKNTPNGYTGCDVTTYINAIATRFAGKGEGIYKNTNPAFAGARGKILNGGGGGNDVNGGGGGGGNYTSGGSGGSGWTPSGAGCSPIAGGMGALSLGGSINGTRIFMGGGGGGGHENDNVGTIGGAGGGIIIIKAGTLTTISCAGISISATGSTAANGINDGAGGGGAGGTIIFNVNTFSVAAGCPITITSNGGSGGGSNLGSSGAHGGGGGGGQGAVIYSGPQPTANVTTSTTPGTGGSSCNGCGAAVNGVQGTGPNNAGVVINASGPLPVELVSFSAEVDDKKAQVRLTWSTAVEKDAKEFVIQQMTPKNSEKEIAVVSAKGSYSHYNYTDSNPSDGINYYRLKQKDLDGRENYSPWVAVDLSNGMDQLMVFPNPVTVGQNLQVLYPGSANELVAEILNVDGRILFVETIGTDAIMGSVIHTGQLPAGVYILKIKNGVKEIYRKLVVSE